MITHDNILFLLILFVLFLMGCIAYFVPSLIAWYKKRPNLKNIFLLNLLSGWTTLGWILALIWALSDVNKVIIVNNGKGPSSPSEGKGKIIDM
ncbi:superinfection immunity protein [Entomobacter blattae]|uniref:Superinfection immunity protein n=1 Tax=Entomobacter blattae TaxID=2762277 RepID=A0A7H1NQW7_9PROT|nr:superinfection immunity protein [Entomobacter blattae]QNT78177.1 Superinfection immunity protein [Entomobacter blattae]